MLDLFELIEVAIEAAKKGKLSKSAKVARQAAGKKSASLAVVVPLFMVTCWATRQVTKEVYRRVKR